MSAYSSFAASIRSTPQSEPIIGKDQVKNNAGGYVFQITPLAQLRRFLILGSAGGTYYASEKALTKQNALSIIELLASPKGPEAVDLIVEVSTQGLAPKVSPVLFAYALAMSSSSLATKKKAVEKFNTIVKTHSHLLEIVSYIRQLRGSGRLFKETVQNWYQFKTPEALAYQLAKYRNRSGYKTCDVLRLVKPVPKDKGHDALYAWAVGKTGKEESLPSIIQGLERAASSEKPDLKLIESYKLTWEMIPTQWLNDVKVWEYLLPNLGLTALIRNLGKMTSIGVLAPLSSSVKHVVGMLTNEEALRKARIHPFNVLVALTTYKKGCGVKGSLTWTPNPQVLDALEKAFYLSFKNIEPTGKNILIALDVSGSMSWDSSKIHNTHITAKEASMAMAMATMRSEANYHLVGFSNTMVDIPVTASYDLNSALQVVSRIPMGGTDCALPFIWGKQNKVDFDACIIYTDNDTWCGRIHPVQALDQYQQSVGHEVKSIVVGMTSTGFSIADPSKPNMLDVVGFDSSAPGIMSDFIRGNI